MQNLKRLNLIASELAPMGALFYFGPQLALKADQLPRLEHLKLENIYLTGEFLAFIRGHNPTLKKLELRDCTAASREESNFSEEHPSWAEIFADIRESQTSLEKLIITPHNACISTEEDDAGGESNVDINSLDEPQATKAARRVLREDPRRRAFDYAQTWEKYGERFSKPEEYLIAFQKGDNQREFDSLVEMVEGNVSGYRSPKLGVL